MKRHTTCFSKDCFLFIENCPREIITCLHIYMYAAVSLFPERISMRELLQLQLFTSSTTSSLSFLSSHQSRMRWRPANMPTMFFLFLLFLLFGFISPSQAYLIDNSCKDAGMFPPLFTGTPYICICWYHAIYIYRYIYMAYIYWWFIGIEEILVKLNDAAITTAKKLSNVFDNSLLKKGVPKFSHICEMAKRDFSETVSCGEEVAEDKGGFKSGLRRMTSVSLSLSPFSSFPSSISPLSGFSYRDGLHYINVSLNRGKLTDSKKKKISFT